MVSVSASHTVGREFASRPGHTTDHHKMVQTASLHGTQCVRVVQSDCLKGRVVYGTLYGDMHLKYLGLIVRVEYRIPVPDFYCPPPNILPTKKLRHINQCIAIRLK